MIIDFHAHILPGLDSGCPARLVTIRQLLTAKHAGVDTIVAASEYDPATTPIADFLQRRDEIMEHMEIILQPGMPRVIPGAEVLWHPGLEKLDRLEEVCVAGRTLLLRVQPGESIAAVAASVEALRKRLGGGVLLANAETLPESDAALLFDHGAKGELSFSALEHRADRERWLPLIAHGDIAVLGSNLRGEQQPYRRLRRLERKLGPAFDDLMHNAEELLEAERSIGI